MKPQFEIAASVRAEEYVSAIQLEIYKNNLHGHFIIFIFLFF